MPPLEVDQHADAGQCQTQRHRDRQVGNECVAAVAADDPKDQQAEQKCGDKGAQYDLIAAVTHEAAQQARPELRGRQGERNDRDRERHTGDGDHGTGDGGEHLARTLGLAGPEQTGLGQPASGVAIDGDGHGRQRGEHQRHQRRYEPEARLELLPEISQPAFHSLSMARGGEKALA
ncbi:MAG: hypothetical protein RQ736_14160 [Thiogranum sp.]|nr:hypothetical protein [Thiogranum sp.]